MRPFRATVIARRHPDNVGRIRVCFPELHWVSFFGFVGETDSLFSRKARGLSTEFHGNTAKTFVTKFPLEFIFSYDKIEELKVASKIS